MFGSGRNLVRANENGDYVIDHEVSPEAFAAVLDYYRNGRIKCPPTVAVCELHDACDFFQLEFSTASVQCADVAKFLHELSNQGAKQQFHSFLQRSLVPAMARCADLGERQCHIVVLSENDTVEWDEEMPPQLGEQYAKGRKAAVLLVIIVMWGASLVSLSVITLTGIVDLQWYTTAHSSASSTRMRTDPLPRRC
jgi:BTB/POZ domain-containing protein 10